MAFRIAQGESATAHIAPLMMASLSQCKALPFRSISQAVPIQPPTNSNGDSGRNKVTRPTVNPEAAAQISREMGHSHGLLSEGKIESQQPAVQATRNVKAMALRKTPKTSVNRVAV